MLGLVVVISVSSVAAQEFLGVVDSPQSGPDVTAPAEEGSDAAEEEAFKLFEYGSKGLDIRSRDGNYHAHIEWRAQMRITSWDFDDPIAPGSSTATATS